MHALSERKENLAGRGRRWAIWFENGCLSLGRKFGIDKTHHRQMLLQPIAGFFGPAGAMPTQCPANSYCPAGSSAPSPCPANRTSPAGSLSVSACVVPSVVFQRSAACYDPAPFFISISHHALHFQVWPTAAARVNSRSRVTTAMLAEWRRFALRTATALAATPYHALRIPSRLLGRPLSPTVAQRLATGVCQAARRRNAAPTTTVPPAPRPRRPALPTPKASVLHCRTIHINTTSVWKKKRLKS